MEMEEEIEEGAIRFIVFRHPLCRARENSRFSRTLGFTNQPYTVVCQPVSTINGKGRWSFGLGAFCEVARIFYLLRKREVPAAPLKW